MGDVHPSSSLASSAPTPEGKMKKHMFGKFLLCGLDRVPSLSSLLLALHFEPLVVFADALHLPHIINGTYDMVSFPMVNSHMKG
jgi:hypothetical protein